MENSNQMNESKYQAAESSPKVSNVRRLAHWAKNTVYGFAGLVLLALVITVVSPEVAVGVSQYLPKEYQETIFASSASGGSCSAGMPVGGYAGSCPSMGSCCGAPTSCCASGAASPMADDSLAAEIPNLSLDTMLTGLEGE